MCAATPPSVLKSRTSLPAPQQLGKAGEWVSKRLDHFHSNRLQSQALRSANSTHGRQSCDLFFEI